jgi:ABC-type uncharacterized transport system permease subunit
MIPAPITNPKSYHPPLLWTSYRLILSVNNEMKNVTGAITPCHRPRQKPATTMLSGEAVLRDSFGPAVHAVIIKKTAMMIINVKIVFFILIGLNINKTIRGYRLQVTGCKLQVSEADISQTKCSEIS